MADASGQGFTASIVNSIPNYLSADRSTLGQIGGVTGAIQYVKLVWGNSGNAYFVDDQGDNPTPLPISLNNAENYWLIDAVLNTVKTQGGASAVNVNVVNSTGLCFAGLNVSLGSELFIAGVCAPIQGIGSNLGVTFGGITVGPLRVRNFVAGSGVTESIQVTFGTIGGTVNVANLNIGNVNFGASGIAISGWSGGAGASLPAHIVGGTLDGINSTVNVNIKSRDFGFTFATVLQSSSGTNIGHSGGTFVGFPVVGVSGGFPVAVTGGVSITGTPTVSLTGSPSITGSVHILGTPTVSGTVVVSSIPAVTGSVYIQGTPTVSLSSGTTVNVQTASGTTLGTVLVDRGGTVVGYSGSTFLGYPVQIVGGLSLSGLTIAGLTVTIPASFSISGGTVAISGGTLSSLTILGGTFAALNITNISGGTINIGNKVQVFNKTGADVLDTYITNNSVPVQATTWNASSPNESLKTHLEGGAAGLGLKVTGISIGSGFTLTNIDPALLGTTGISGSRSGLGVTFGKISGTVDLASGAIVNVKGDSSSLTTSPVGVTLLGDLKHLVAPGISAAGVSVSGSVLGIGVYGKNGSGGYTPVGMSGDALKVSLEGVGLCLGSVTVTGVCFGNGITLVGGTANFLNVLGGTIAVLNIGNISGGTINVGNTVGITGSVGILNTGTTIANDTVQKPIKVHLTKNDGTFFADYDKGIPVIGLTQYPMYVQGLCGAYPQTVVNGVTTWAVGVSFGSVGVYPAKGSSGIGGQSGGGTTFNVVLTDILGRPIGYGVSGAGATFFGFPVFGVSGATALGVTFSAVRLGGFAGAIFDNLASRTTVTAGNTAYWLGVTFDGSFGASVTVNVTDVFIKATGSTGIGGQSGGGTTFNVVLTDILGRPIGYGVSGAGATFFGFPVFGVSGATALRVTGTVSIVPERGSSGIGGQSGGGTTFNVVLTDVLGRPIGYGVSGAGATFQGFPVFGVAGVTAVNINIKGFDAFEGGITFRGNCLGAGICAASIPSSYAGGTYFRISPVEGLLEEPGFTLTGKVSVVGDSNSGIGVTFTLPSSYTISGSGIGVTLGSDAVNIKSSSPSNTFGSVLVGPTGIPIGFSGSTFTGFPVVGISGGTPIGVTFGAISFGAAGMGVTFSGITFATTRTVIVGSSFADGGGNLGIPVFGVQGATSVRVLVEGGTVAGIFVAESPGITVMGVTTGIPVIGVTGATPIAVTFAASPTTLNLPSGGITIASIASGVVVGVSGGTIGIATIGGGNVTVSGEVSLSAGSNTIGAVEVKNSGANSTKLMGDSAAAGLLVTHKAGPAFARGLTLDNLFIGITNTSAISNLVGVCGSDYYYLKTSPVCVTTNYSGDGVGNPSTVNGEVSVPLKEGVWIQLTKWDLISHVLVGYTAATPFEFERNAQVLTKEYQMAPVWSHAMDQFRRFPGYTGNNNPIRNNDFWNDQSISNAQTYPGAQNNITGVGVDASGSIQYYWNPAAQKQFIGLIEKPTRIFVPCRDAGLVYVQVKGDYANHAIGSGFWDQETGRWSATSLYERSYYASSFYGFTGGEPNLDVNGQGACGGVDYGGGVGVAPSTTIGGGGFAPAIAQILSSYTNNPFIRIWGY